MGSLDDRAPISELEQFGVDLKTINFLEAKGIIYIRQLLMMTRDELRSIPNIGPSIHLNIIKSIEGHREYFGW